MDCEAPKKGIAVKDIGNISYYLEAQIEKDEERCNLLKPETWS